MAECEEETEVLNASLKRFIRAVADARDVTHRCDVHRLDCELLEDVEREELEAEKDLFTQLMSFMHCVAKKR